MQLSGSFCVFLKHYHMPFIQTLSHDNMEGNILFKHVLALDPVKISPNNLGKELCTPAPNSQDIHPSWAPVGWITAEVCWF